MYVHFCGGFAFILLLFFRLFGTHAIFVSKPECEYCNKFDSKEPLFLFWCQERVRHISLENSDLIGSQFEFSSSQLKTKGISKQKISVQFTKSDTVFVEPILELSNIFLFTLGVIGVFPMFPSLFPVCSLR